MTACSIAQMDHFRTKHIVSSCAAQVTPMTKRLPGRPSGKARKAGRASQCQRHEARGATSRRDQGALLPVLLPYELAEEARQVGASSSLQARDVRAVPQRPPGVSAPDRRRRAQVPALHHAYSQVCLAVHAQPPRRPARRADMSARCHKHARFARSRRTFALLIESIHLHLLL